MNTRTQGLVLVLFGGALVRLAASDLLLRYVRPVARPWVLIAGIAIAGLGLWSLLAARNRHGLEADRQIDAHGHSSAARAGWLVLAPVVAILVVAPPALGSYTAHRTPVAVTKPSDVSFPALPSGAPVDVPMLDYVVRALWDAGRTLDGRSLRLTGMVTEETGGGFTIARLVITCCAADARPVFVGVDYRGARLPKNKWVTVTGEYAGLSSTDADLPMLRATAVRAIAPPRNPYDD